MSLCNQLEITTLFFRNGIRQWQSGCLREVVQWPVLTVSTQTRWMFRNLQISATKGGFMRTEFKTVAGYDPRVHTCGRQDPHLFDRTLCGRKRCIANELDHQETPATEIEPELELIPWLSSCNVSCASGLEEQSTRLWFGTINPPVHSCRRLRGWGQCETIDTQ